MASLPFESGPIWLKFAVSVGVRIQQGGREGEGRKQFIIMLVSSVFLKIKVTETLGLSLLGKKPHGSPHHFRIFVVIILEVKICVQETKG